MVNSFEILPNKEYHFKMSPSNGDRDQQVIILKTDTIGKIFYIDNNVPYENECW
jgi:hypothetical protein